MGEVSNRLSSSWQMRSDVSPPPVSLSFPRMTKKDHTSEASWSAFLKLTCNLFRKARLGVNGFGFFSRQKSASATGPKSGNPENYGDVRTSKTRPQKFSANTFLLEKFKVEFRYTRYSCIAICTIPKNPMLKGKKSENRY